MRLTLFDREVDNSGGREMEMISFITCRHSSMAEQLKCNQQIRGSNPGAGSNILRGSIIFPL